MTATQTRSLLLAIGIHVLIAILLMFLYISTPNPPFEEGLAVVVVAEVLLNLERSIFRK